MSLRGFQQALSELVMTPALKRRIAEGDQGALDAYELSPRERQRLLSLARDPGLKTGTTIHRSFRLSMLANALPRTYKLLAPQELKLLVQAYWREHLPRSLQYLPEARRFAEFALARVRAGAIENPYAAEVLEAELAIVTLARAGVWQGPREGQGEEGGSALAEAGHGNGRLDRSGAERGGALLRMDPLCRVTFFRHDPDAVLAALAEGRVPAELPEGEHCLLLVARGEGRVDFKPLGREVGRVLRACASAAVRAAELPERTGLLDGECGAAVAEALREGWLVLAS